jgi:hypothetical protein
MMNQRKAKVDEFKSKVFIVRRNEVVPTCPSTSEPWKVRHRKKRISCTPREKDPLKPVTPRKSLLQTPKRKKAILPK